MDKITKTKIYKVSFREPIDGKTDYYFGSIAAIYKLFTPEQVGCVKGTLYAHKFFSGDIKTETRNCRITTDYMYRSKQQEA